MDKELAKQLLFLVNDKSMMDLLDKFIQYRIDWNKEQLTKENDIDNIRKTQGAIIELRRNFQSLRSTVLEKVK